MLDSTGGKTISRWNAERARTEAAGRVRAVSTVKIISGLLVLLGSIGLSGAYTYSDMTGAGLKNVAFPPQG